MKNKAYELSNQPDTFYADQFGSSDVKKANHFYSLALSQSLADW